MEVKLGKYKINNLVAEHWAIKIGTTWYEVEGASKSQSGDRNKIAIHTNDSKYATITTLGKISGEDGTTQQLLKQMIQDWLKNHPFYAINGDNCQLFVKHMAWELLGITIETQNKQIGSAAIGAGFGAIVVGLGAILVGLLVKGGH